MSGTTRQKYAEELAELREQQVQLRETLANFCVQIGQKHAQ